MLKTWLPGILGMFSTLSENEQNKIFRELIFCLINREINETMTKFRKPLSAKISQNMKVFWYSFLTKVSETKMVNKLGHFPVTIMTC